MWVLVLFGIVGFILICVMYNKEESVEKNKRTNPDVQTVPNKIECVVDNHIDRNMSKAVLMMVLYIAVPKTAISS